MSAYSRGKVERNAKDNGFILHKSIAIQFHNPYAKTIKLHILGQTHAHSLEMSMAVIRLYAADIGEEDRVLQSKTEGQLPQPHSSKLNHTAIVGVFIICAEVSFL